MSLKIGKGLKIEKGLNIEWVSSYKKRRTLSFSYYTIVMQALL